MRRITLSTAVLLSALLLTWTTLWQATPAARAQDASPSSAISYKADPAHTSIAFEVGHLGINHIYGLFTNSSGSFTLDKSNPGACNFEFATQTADLTTGVPKRDHHLRSPDFFNVAEFPTITFKSTSVTAGSAAGMYNVTGDLTLHGVTKSITITLQNLGEATMMGQSRTGLVTEFTVKRSDFGMTKFIPMVSDEVKVMVGTEGIKQ